MDSDSPKLYNAVLHKYRDILKKNGAGETGILWVSLETWVFP